MRINRKEQNIAVFEDTMAWLRQNGTLRDAVEETKKRTVFYPASSLPDGGASRGEEAERAALPKRMKNSFLAFLFPPNVAFAQSLRKPSPNGARIVWAFRTAAPSTKVFRCFARAGSEKVSSSFCPAAFISVFVFCIVDYVIEVVRERLWTRR